MRARLSALAVVSALSIGCGASKPAGPQSAATAKVAPANPVAVSKMVQGVQAAKDGQRDRAAALLREAIQVDPSLWEARFDLGVVLVGTGDLAGAEDQLASAAKLAPESEEIRRRADSTPALSPSESIAVALGEVRRRRGEAKLAAQGLADYVRDHPAAVEARTLYVAALRESGQIDKAIAEAREVLVRKPADATALAELALSHLAKGEKDAAALLAKQALDASPNSAVAHRATGLLDLANGDDAEAFSEFRKAAQADPRDTTSRLNMGVVLLRAGAYSKAAQQYREILKVSADDVEAQVGLAAALRGEADAQHPQKLDEARTLLEKVLAADPHNTSALFNLGVLYQDFLKKPAEAAPLFKRFLAEAPSDHPLRAEAERYVSAANAANPVGGGPAPGGAPAANANGPAPAAGPSAGPAKGAGAAPAAGGKGK